MNAGEIIISEGGWNIHGGSPCLHGEIPAIWPAWNVQYEGNLVVQFSEDTTVTCRICEAIKDQIRQGIYEPGASLPSTRALAAEWDVSRATVTAAYAQLSAIREDGKWGGRPMAPSPLREQPS
jgi:hypothetical protein